MNRHPYLEPRHHLVILFLAAVAVSALTPTLADAQSPDEIKALDQAGLLAKQAGALPIVLTGIRPRYVSELAEAWTVRDPATGQGLVVIYTGSATFRCAMPPEQKRQCVIKLASILMHEAWHLKYGSDERHAYDAQLTFLELQGGSGQLISSVRRAKAGVLARQKDR